MSSTKQDPRGAGWAICDRVVQLRHWGTSTAISLDGASEWVAGTEGSLVLVDPSGRVSRRHASIKEADGVWLVQDLDSTNGTRQDGELRRSFQLAPGDVIELGPIKLVAESKRSMELRNLLQRFVGWLDSRLPDVDAALSSVREMATLRNVLVLRGHRRPDRRRAQADGPYLAGVVIRLHELTLGSERSLVFHDGTASGGESLKRAIDGLLCIDAKTAPRDLPQMATSLRLPDTRVRLVVCAAMDDDVEHVLTRLPRITTIAIPSLSDRHDEFERLLEEYAGDAAAKLGAADLAFRPQDPTWLRNTGVQTLDELEEDARRLVALRNWNVVEGAKRLGITHGALSQWARIRKIPT